jgi:glycine cleavage system H protein
MSDQPSTLSYKRARFKTHLPVKRMYAPSHFWMEEVEPGLWRAGFTKFASRMLGDLVEHDFEVKEEEAIELGQIIGWIEGFKATSDLYSSLEGKFHRGNPDLRENLDLLRSSPYQKGWLYEVYGQPGEDAMDVHGYAQVLDLAIDKVLEQEK